MIVDNADNASVLAADTPEALLEFLPQSQNGAVLVTSRNREVAYSITGDNRDIITVNPMEEEHAMDLLRTKLQGEFNEDDAKNLVKILDYMPLAISQATAFINQRASHTSVPKYLQDLQKGDSDRAKLLSRNISDNRRDGKTSNSIMATWQISFENIRRERPSAAALLSLMSLFDRQGIPKSLLNHYYQEDKDKDFEEDIYILCSYSLIGTNVEGTEFEMHRLIQFSTKTWLELRGELGRWKEKFIILMDERFPLGEYENWETCQKLFPHVEEAFAYRPVNEEYLSRWATVLHNAAWYAHDQGDYEAAERMNEAAMNLYMQSLGPESPSALNSMANLGLIYENQGRWKEAEDLQAKALEIYKRVQGLEHLDTLTGMANLAMTLWNQGRREEAEQLEVQVMETSKKKLGDDHPDTLTSMANLAATYSNQGRWEEAEQLEVQVLETSKKKLGDDHPDTLNSMANLASTYTNQGRWDEAEQLEVQVIETSKKKLGDDHPSTLGSMANLASTYRNQGRWKEAEYLQTQELEICSRKLGERHPDTLISMKNLALIWKGIGRDVEALQLLQKCVRLRKEILGSDHPYTLSSSVLLTEWEKENLDISS
jgi:tetratricopeptide (TPR) repeat protein